jgi:hypothetical protein
MSLESVRSMLVVAAEYGEAAVQTFAALVLDAWGDEPEPRGARPPLTPAERSKRWRNRHGDRHEPRDVPSRNATAAVTESDGSRDGRDAPRARTQEPDLSLSPSGSQDLQGDLALEGGGVGEGKHVTNGVTTVTNGVTKKVTAVTRKKPVTHCPGPEETPEAVDAWCRGQGIPPASQVPEVDRMIGWHQKAGKPRASWLRTWQDWQKTPAPPGSRPRVEEVDPEERRRAARAFNAEVESKVNAAAAELAKKKAAAPTPDREVAKKAAIASTRAPSAPTTIAGSKPRRVELTPEERERRRQAQLEAAATFDETKKAGGTC